MAPKEFICTQQEKDAAENAWEIIQYNVKNGTINATFDPSEKYARLANKDEYKKYSVKYTLQPDDDDLSPIKIGIWLFNQEGEFEYFDFIAELQTKLATHIAMIKTEALRKDERSEDSSLERADTEDYHASGSSMGSDSTFDTGSELTASDSASEDTLEYTPGSSFNRPKAFTRSSQSRACKTPPRVPHLSDEDTTADERHLLEEGTRGIISNGENTSGNEFQDSFSPHYTRPDRSPNYWGRRVVNISDNDDAPSLKDDHLTIGIAASRAMQMVSSPETGRR